VNDETNYLKYLSKLTLTQLYLTEDDYMKVTIILKNFSNEDMKNLILYYNSLTERITK